MAKPSRFWYPQCDPGQEDRVRQVEQRFVQECGVKPLDAGELYWPSARVDPDTPGSCGWRSECLLVGPVAPATDGLSQRYSWNDGIGPPKKRLPRAAAENRECGGAGDQRAMECKSAEADVECLRGVKEKVVAKQRYIIGTSSDDREEHDPGCGINHPIGIQANSGGKGSRDEESSNDSPEHE